MGQSGGPYFEGWYFKHQWGEETLALIPGFLPQKQGRGARFCR